MDIEVTGIEEACRSIDQTMLQFEQDADDCFQQAGRIWEMEAKSRARVKTGYMKSRVAYVRGALLEAWGVVPVFYSVFVEWGTSRARAFPFVRPAFEIARKWLLERLRRL